MATAILPDLYVDLEEVKAELARRSFRYYVEEAWRVVEPGTEFVPNWHIDAICDHLEAVTRGEIQNLLINIPPRCMKSLIVGVFFPTWVWIDWPESRWLFSSYAQSLSKRDSVKCRRIIESPWYQRNWGDRYSLTTDQNEKLRFENSKTGYRLATSIDGSATGEGGNFVVFDDPHNVKQAISDTQRESALLWWDETMSTRINDRKKDHKIGVMQRLHERDMTGHILEREGDNWTHLMLPMEFEPKRKCVTTLPFEDPRKEEGEPLWERRFDRGDIATMKQELGTYGAAGQLQQRPAPRGGGMFKREWFEIVSAAPVKAKKIRYWDLAGTALRKDYNPSWTRGPSLCLKDGTLYICDMASTQSEAKGVEDLLGQTAELDGHQVHIWIEQEPGSSGKAVIDRYVRVVLLGYTVRGDRPTGPKEVRAEPVAAMAEAGNVKLVKGPWNEEFLREAETFPAGAKKDQIDAVSGGYSKLVASSRAGAWGRRR